MTKREVIESIKLIYSCLYAHIFPPAGALHERNASLPSINNPVSVTVTVSLSSCSCLFPFVPESLFWFPRSFPLCSCSCHDPCVPFLFSVPVHVPVAILDPFLVSLCPCVLVSRPLSTPPHSVIFYSTFNFSTPFDRGYNTCHIC